MRLILAALVSSCIVAVLLPPLKAQENAIANRRIPFDLPHIALPLTPYGLQVGIAQLAWVTRTPIGFEARADQLWKPAPATDRLSIAGSTIKDVLDAITMQDPRYRWSQDEDVIHLRPAISLGDSSSVVDRMIDTFTLDGATLATAVRELQFNLHPEWRQGGIVGSGLSPTPLALQRFDVRISHATVGGVLDAIVKAHGASSWSVTYAGDSRDLLVARITLHTFDGWGVTQ